ncbi:MAG: InlB B-repeat-containing protein [Anaeroplasmataceae bacterium]
MNKSKWIIAIISLVITIILCIIFALYFNLKKHTISFVVDDVTILKIKTRGKENLSLPEYPEKENYYFDGWYFDKEHTLEFNKDSFINSKLKKDINVYAKWYDYTENAQINVNINVFYSNLNKTKYIFDDLASTVFKSSLFKEFNLSEDNLLELSKKGVLNKDKSNLSVFVVRNEMSNNINLYYDLDDIVININQIINEQKISINIENNEEIFKVNVDVYYENELISSKLVSIDELPSESFNVCYGTLKITLTLYDKKGNSEFIIVTETVEAFANEYNIAVLGGTLPVLLFTLKSFESVNIPTFLLIERDNAYDWNKLPKNYYKFYYTNSHFRENFEYMIKWVKDLSEINNKSKFNIFCNDLHTRIILPLIHANNIKNYNVYLISDGTASYSNYNYSLGSDEGDSNYEIIKSNYNSMVTRVKNGEDSMSVIKDYSFVYNYPLHELQYYAVMIAYNDPNVFYWSTNIDMFKTKTSDKAINVLNEFEKNKNVKLLMFKINDLLNNLTESQKDDFYALYKFSDDLFEEAQITGKPVMLILGTHTNNEHYFSEYVNFVKSIYKDEYIYYYKGHPNSPTDDAKIELLNELGLIDVFSTIPAELILSFYNDLTLSGYPSTTFLNNLPNYPKVVFASKSVVNDFGYYSEYYISHDVNNIFNVEYKENDKVDQWDSEKNDYVKEIITRTKSLNMNCLDFL